MIISKKMDRIVLIAVIIALLTVSVLYGLIKTMDLSAKRSEPDYVSKVFGGEILSIEIIADEADWQEMLDNATSESFIMADVIVNGTRFSNVGIRPKGNSSLTQVAASDSDRYSFRIQFNEYIEGQTCFGLESFVVNNMLGDATYMKEYISYDLMREIGVDAPLTGFADIKVNGESWGLYLAVELYNDSYENRVFGDISGMLYNVKSMDMGGDSFGAGRDFPNMEDLPARGRRSPGMNENGAFQMGGEDFSSIPEGGFTPPQGESGESGRPGAGNGGFTMPQNGFGFSRGGGSLQYTDDDPSSYSSIFDNVVGKGTESDYKRVIKALKALAEGQDLEKFFDVDQILRYLAAHTIVVNLDSYSSGMAQNYYIYERDGQITILPWDYNLAWGGFQSSGASAVVNFPIDTPVSGVELSDRPLLEKLFANEEYLSRYHQYLQDLMDNYFADGKFQAKVEALDQLIGDYVKNDATAFYTYKEYKASLPVLIDLGNRRAESIQGQLDGTIPSTTQGQQENPELLVSAEGINLSVLGTMGGGRMQGGMGAMPAWNPGGINGQMPAWNPDDMSEQMPAWNPGNMTGQLPDGDMRPTDGTSGATVNVPDRNMGNFPGMMNGGRENPFGNSGGFSRNINTSALYAMVIALVLMVFTTVFLAKKKRNY